MATLSAQTLAALSSGALVVSLGGGVVCMADHAVPGDALYGVDVKVGEPLKAAVATSPGAKIRQATDRAEERLDEAGDLALDRGLVDDLANDLSLKFQGLVNDAQQKIANLADVNPDLAAELIAEQERMLNSKADLLASLSLHADAATQASLDKLESAARVEADAAKKLRIAIDRTIGGTGLETHAQAALDVAVSAVADAQADALAAKSALSAAANADLNAQLNAANHALANGQAQLQAGAFVEASEILNSASRIAAEASLFAEVMANLESTGNLDAKSVLDAVKAKGTAEVVGGSSGQAEVEGDGLNLEVQEGVTDDSGQVVDVEAVLDVDGLLPDTGIELDVHGKVVSGAGDLLD